MGSYLTWRKDTDETNMERLVKNLSFEERRDKLFECCRTHFFEGREYDVDVILSYGVGVNEMDENGYTALGAACLKGNYNIAPLLVLRGADVNVRDKRGYTPLMKACKIGSDSFSFQNTIQILLENGAYTDFGTERHGATAAMLAVKYKKVKCLEKLLSWDPNLDLMDKDGQTVLSYAVRRRNTQCLKLLLVEGKLLTRGKLRPVHKKSVSTVHIYVESLLVMIEAGVFEWEWCHIRYVQPVLRAAFKSGYCPGLIKCGGPTKTLSPLILSLIQNDTDLAKTFLRHLYYFPEDYRRLSTSDHKKISNRIRNKTILDEITRQPLSLQTWSFLTVSKSISVAGPPGLRRQRVDALPIPDTFKRKLKFESG